MGKLIIFNIKSHLGKRSCIILCALILLIISSTAFSQKLTVTFDASGNQTKRVWVCINCPTLNSDNITSVGNSQSDMIKISKDYTLHINRDGKTVQIHSENEDKTIIPIISLVNFEDRRKVAIDSFKKKGIIGFATDKLVPRIYLLRICIGDNHWTEIIIEKVREV
ncbi:hypothetical protein ACR78Z_03960 [Sphingobacterium thalpophilum]|uniref:Uncharacterized protein n=1 Tax=Sphingobacterium thalpophilum TaxID=259 RepID=A0ABV4H9Y2_9SPHI|nr:hypothetical protein [Sphingobacterium thalpophilum]